jgi:Uma2 family endonuclease
MIVTVINESQSVRVPSWVVDLESFRRWLDSAELPDHARPWFLKGEVWIDMSKEQVFSHVHVKTEFTIVVGGLVKAQRLGRFFADGVLLSNEEADISGNPDATFVSNESLKKGRVRLVEGIEEGYVELEGAPDMVLEVVSTSSVHKDRVILKQAYWEAGSREYWVVDARTEPPVFDILRHTAKGYVTVRKQDGWSKSAVFGKAFRLTSQKDALGHPNFTLAVR